MNEPSAPAPAPAPAPGQPVQQPYTAATSSSELPVLTVGDVIDMVGRHLRLAVTAAAIAGGLVVIATALKTPLYEAQATITLDRRPRPVEYVNGGPQFDPYTGNYEHDLLNTQRTILMSRSVLENALKTGGLQLNEGYVATADAIDHLRERLTISTSRDSWDLVISLRDEEQRRAESGLQAVLDSYRAWQLAQSKDRSERAISFLQGQAAEALQHLQQVRDEKQAFQRDKGLFVLDPEHCFPAQRLQALNSRKVVLGQQISALQTLVDQIKGIDALPGSEERMQALLALDAVNRNPTVGEQQKLLYELKTMEAQLAEKYLEKHPRLIEIRSQIATKHAQLESAVRAVHDGLLADYAKLLVQLSTLETSIKLVETELNSYRENLFRLQTMEEQTKTAEQIYESLLRHSKEESISHQEDSVMMALVDPPRASHKAVNVSWSLTLLTAALLGCVGGLAAPLAVEFFGRRVYGASGVRNLIFAPVIGELPFVVGLAHLGSRGDPNQPIQLAEALRSLRTSLRLRRRSGQRGTCIAITSCEQSEGKSTIAARLAVTMAISGLKVLLVDGDLRQHSLDEQLGQTCERGLSELLAGEPNMVASSTGYPNLDFLDSGASTPRPGELLNSHCLPEWLEFCRSLYDYILIDTPALTLFSDALLVGEHADGIVMVVRDGLTLKSSLARGRAMLTPLSSRLIGAVLVARRDVARQEEPQMGAEATVEPSTPIPVA